MTECPVCKRKSSTVGPKPLWDKKVPTKSPNDQERAKTVTMCQDCLNSYIKGELRLDL